MRLAILILLASLCSGSLLAQRNASPASRAPQVTRLEAIHAAEIHTGAAAQSVTLLGQGPSSIYQVELMRDGVRYRVQVHADHGRLLWIAHAVPGGAWQMKYQWPGIRVVAHRGGALLGPPENTLPAIQKAIEIGADLIEIDIRETKDGHLVLMHDETVDRTTNGRGRVRDLSLDEIRKLEVKNGGGPAVRVPTLREALEAMRGQIDPDLDFKEGDLEKLVAVVRDMGLVESATMYGPPERCLALTKIEPGIRIRPTAEYPQQVPGLIRELRPAMVNLDWHAVTEEAVRLAHLGGCHAFVNCLSTADTEFYMRLAAEMGADYIQSDRPDLVVKVLNEMNLRPQRPPSGDPLGTPLRAPHLQYPLR